MKFELRQHFRIESARRLTGLPENHPCARLHGHSFQIVLTLVGERDPRTGWVMDYHEISRVMEPLLKELDHRVLNDVAGLENPTSENLAFWIHEKAKPLLPSLTRVTVMETPQTECSYPALSSR